MKKYWIIPALSAIAAILAVLLSGCTLSYHSNQSEQSEDNVVASMEAASEEAAIDAATPGQEPAVIVYNGSQTISDKPAKTVVIDFNATWCGPCREYAPQFHRVAEKMAGKAVFYSIDVDKYPALAEKYGAHAIPLTVVISPDGKVEKKIGYMDASELENMLR